MANIILRLAKGTPLTDQEMDNNFNNLNIEQYYFVTNSTPWLAATVVAKGEILSYNNRFYEVTVAGTTGVSPPTNPSGTAVNGSTTLRVIIPPYYSAKDVLDKVKSLQGTGSGLDSEFLRGLSPFSLMPTVSDKTSLVSRDSSGNFTANVITATLNGNALTATNSQFAVTATNINGGTADVTTLTVVGNTSVGSSGSNTFNLKSALGLNGVVGTDGQVLISKGPNNIPTWQSINSNPTINGTNVNAKRFLTFVENTGVQQLFIDNSGATLTYNPAINELDANITGNAATATTVTGNGVEVGTISIWAGPTSTIPDGYLACPPATTLVNVADYPLLAAKISNRWGGNGSTTIGLPIAPLGYTPIAGVNATVGTLSVGEVIAHAHTYQAQTTPALSTAGGGAHVVGAYTATSGSTGGDANRAAGFNVIFIVRYK